MLTSVKLLTPTMMVDNLSEKVEEYSLLSVVGKQLEPLKLSIIQSSRVSTIQGIKVNGRTVGTFRIVRYIHC